MQYKIFIIHLRRSGPDRGDVWPAVRWLLGAGHEVTVVCPAAGSGGDETAGVAGVRIVHGPEIGSGTSAPGLPATAWILLRTTILTWWVFLRHGFDVIHGMVPPDQGFLVAFPFKLFGVKFVLDRATCDALPSLQRWTGRYACRVADVAVVADEDDRRAAVDLGLAAENVFVADGEAGATDTFPACYQRVCDLIRQDDEASTPL